MSDVQLSLDVTLARRDSTVRMAQVLRWQGVLGLTGDSGAGKTSLLRLLAGLEPDARGRIELDGEVLQNSAAGIRLAPHRRRIGLVFQDARLFTHLDVAGNLQYAQQRAARGATAPTYDDVTAALGIGKLLQCNVEILSGGQAQRVAIARALLAAPRLLLLDEPVSALDARARDEVLSCIEQVRDRFNLPMIYVSHAHDEIARLASVTLRISRGQFEPDTPTMRTA